MRIAHRNDYHQLAKLRAGSPVSGHSAAVASAVAFVVLAAVESPEETL